MVYLGYKKFYLRKVSCIQTIKDPIVLGFAMPRKEPVDVVFIEILLKSNFLKVVLVSVKSRVGPLRKTTIPRLGHFSNLLLSRLLSSAINICIWLIKFLLEWFQYHLCMDAGY